MTVTGNLKTEPLQAKAVLKTFLAFEIVQVTPELVDEAVDCSVLHQLSFWDALIVVAAEAAGSTTLYSEDFNAGQSLPGMQVVSPFAPQRREKSK